MVSKAAYAPVFDPLRAFNGALNEALNGSSLTKARLTTTPTSTTIGAPRLHPQNAEDGQHTFGGLLKFVVEVIFKVLQVLQEVPRRGLRREGLESPSLDAEVKTLRTRCGHVGPEVPRGRHLRALSRAPETLKASE
jgi:hypothetical protein